MQTFLPYPDSIESAKVLDRQRLGKQRVESLQILQTLRGISDGWKNHPAVLMWKGYEEALFLYGYVICQEWISRGYKDTCAMKMANVMNMKIPLIISYVGISFPYWFGSQDFHQSHKSNLLRKFPEHYRKFWPSLRDDLPYVWPGLKNII